MHTATWLCRDQRLRETCATPPCAPHWLPDAPLSCWVAQLARRHRTSNVELASRAICDVLAWCPWWTVSRSTRTVSVEVVQRHCVCTVVQTHRACHMFSDPLCPFGSGYGRNCFMASASASCVRVCCCVVVELHSSPPWWFQSCVFRSFRRRAFAWFFSRLCEERHIVVCSLSE